MRYDLILRSFLLTLPAVPSGSRNQSVEFDRCRITKEWFRTRLNNGTLRTIGDDMRMVKALHHFCHCLCFVVARTRRDQSPGQIRGYGATFANPWTVIRPPSLTDLALGLHCSAPSHTVGT
ncbi:uncharacterized protein BO95DRAFT_448591 [Aspergillus brunneoviolaceus CBS 621.78]|uniref:Uncharacterized protein n=1 Tax=Aspergillus brunneoviolaceus CBS 621.78 TaxID=1450534 RepID=A0ACD1FRJ8_9EURO|nr:hypothetical protein BO95DRAFT_448591 [Aspergillus brunneoviolaceus CBS 621.78]RAH39593.1 hypothetical protein BO95DRAFT_448591 [Aspergillus brunneoviolaceus CBS 621.78]